MTARRQEGEDVPSLFARGVRNGHHALGEAIAALALRSEGALPPQHEGAQFALAVVAGRLHVVALDEGPEGLAVLEDVRARAGEALDAQRQLHVPIDDSYISPVVVTSWGCLVACS